MKYEVIFCIFALVLTAGVVGAFAWALLGHSKGGRAEEARTADNLAKSMPILLNSKRPAV